VAFDADFFCCEPSPNRAQVLGHLFNWGLFGVLSVQVCKSTRSRHPQRTIHRESADIYYLVFNRTDPRGIKTLGMRGAGDM
jgi:hypothetical protein